MAQQDVDKLSNCLDDVDRARIALRQAELNLQQAENERNICARKLGIRTDTQDAMREALVKRQGDIKEEEDDDIVCLGKSAPSQSAVSKREATTVAFLNYDRPRAGDSSHIIKSESSDNAIPRTPPPDSLQELFSTGSTQSKRKTSTEIPAHAAAHVVATRRKLAIVDTVNNVEPDQIRERRHAKTVQKKKETPVKKEPVGKKESGLDEHTVLSRLRLIGDPRMIELPDGGRHLRVSRAFVSAMWGGNPQSVYPPIALVSKTRRSEYLVEHNDLAMMNRLHNPDAPASPGAPGLFLQTTSAEGQSWMTRPRAPNGPDARKKINRIFVCEDTNKWLYMGQYQYSALRSLSAEEWKMQSDTVRDTWAAKLANEPCGWNIRISIGLRKRLGRKATEQEQQQAEAEADAHTGYPTKPQEILDAYDSGEEIFGIWGMICVGYDMTFYKEMAANWPVWVANGDKFVR